MAQVSFSTPIRLTGFSKLPNIGSLFTTAATKKDAEERALENKNNMHELVYAREIPENTTGIAIIPIIIKSDVYGSAEAIEAEIMKIEIPDVYFKIIKKGVGAISESDIQLAIADRKTIILGFHVDMDSRARDLIAGDMDEPVTVETFTIIYKLTEWLQSIGLERKPLKEVDQVLATAKVLKHFSTQKNVHLIGARVLSGIVTKGSLLKFSRNGEYVGSGKIIALQQGKSPTDKVETDSEFGTQIESSVAPEPGDMIEVFQKVIQ